MHVGAHPHTCLQTFTWVMEGEIHHRDSLGSEQIVRPGQVNLMTAGRGIVHTEDSVEPGQRLHAAQLWLALPPHLKDEPPAFDHYPTLPQWQEAGCRFTLLVGRQGEQQAPTRVHTPLLAIDMACTEESRVCVPLQAGFEHAFLVLGGEARIGQDVFHVDAFAYLAPGVTQIELTLAAGSRILLIGGEPFEPPILMWWNFVGFSQDEIRRSQADWEAGHERFGRVPQDGGRRLAAPPLPWARNATETASGKDLT